MKIATRLALVFGVITSILFGLSGILVIRFLQADLYRTIDRSLLNRAPFLESALTRAELGFIGPFGPPNRPITLNGSRVIPVAQLISPAGKILESLGGIYNSPLIPTTQIKGLNGQTEFINANPHPLIGQYRVLLEPSRLHHGDTLVVARPISSASQTISRVKEYFWLGWLIVTSLATIGGYLLARRALAPVEEIRRQAESVDVEADTFALNIPNTNDEIEALGRTMNELLARLHNSISDQRAFLSNASHELRTPLASLTLELELANFANRSVSDLHNSVRRALLTAQAMSRLTDDLFLLAVLDENQKQMGRKVTEVTPVVRDAVTFRGDLAERSGIQVNLSSTSVALANIDTSQIRLAIGNLIDNAVRHSSHIGEVQVCVSDEPGIVRIGVTDHGEGFPPEFVPIAFERFTRPDSARDRAGGGAGLGLALVRAVAEAHGGSAEISATGADGSTVSICLPIWQAETGTDLDSALPQDITDTLHPDHQ